MINHFVSFLTKLFIHMGENGTRKKKAPRKREAELTRRDRGMPSEAHVVISHIAHQTKTSPNKKDEMRDMRNINYFLKYL